MRYDTLSKTTKKCKQKLTGITNCNFASNFRSNMANL